MDRAKVEGQAGVRKAPCPGGHGHEKDPGHPGTDDKMGDSPMPVPLLDELLGEEEGADGHDTAFPRVGACTGMPPTPPGTT